VVGSGSAQRPVVVAHRGASASAPENTLAAFARAVEQGADGVELDVHRSRDGELVVHHDADADAIGLLRDATFAQIRSARPDIPTLAEVFEVTGTLLVNVEIKCCSWDPDPDPDHFVAAAIVALVRSLDIGERIVVSSFDLSHIDAVRELDADLSTGFLVHGHDPATMVGLCVERGHAWLHPDWGNLARCLESTVAAARGAGVRLDPWTVDDPVVMRRFAAAGVDAFITNDPALALRALS
jgi:glycerophosphoryl diester phosphodiesterase